MAWTKFLKHEIEFVMGPPGKMEYHNIQHVMDCYNFLEKMDVPYSWELDVAVLFHDCIYDHMPLKEERSAVIAMERYLASAGEIVMVTKHHRISECKTENQKWMVRADLHQLADPVKAIENYYKIKDENLRLYQKSEQETLVAMEKYMIALYGTCSNNYMRDCVQFDGFWNDVMEGIRIVIRQIRGDLGEPKTAM